MIGIIGAMASEVNSLKEKMNPIAIDKISSVEFCQGVINGCEVVVAQAGVGKVNAAVTAQTMILKYGVDCLINVGVAGGLEPSLKIGDAVVAQKVVEHDMDTTPVGDEPGFITGINKVYMDCDTEMTDLLVQCTEELGIHTVRGVIASGDQFICRDDQRDKLINIFNAAAAEMEGAAIGHVCTMNNVKFCVLRAISDCANDDSKITFKEFELMAAEKSTAVISLFLSRL